MVPNGVTHQVVRDDQDGAFGTGFRVRVQGLGIGFRV